MRKKNTTLAKQLPEKEELIITREEFESSIADSVEFYRSGGCKVSEEFVDGGWQWAPHENTDAFAHWYEILGFTMHDVKDALVKAGLTEKECKDFFVVYGCAEEDLERLGLFDAYPAKLGTDFRIAIPQVICETLGLRAGELLSVSVKGGQIVHTRKGMTEKEWLDAIIEEGERDYEAGRVSKTFRKLNAYKRYLEEQKG